MAKIALRLYHHEIEALIEQRELDAAIAHCRHILQTFPKCLDTYRLLGKAYLEARRYPEAIDIFRRLLMAIPDDFIAHVGMALIHDEQGKLDEAIWHMTRAFEVQPANRAIQAELQRLHGQRDGVMPPRIRLTRGALAHMYVRGQLYLEAIEEIRAILKDEPSRYDMQTLLAKAYFFGGYKKEAAEISTQILNAYPYNFEANRVLSELSASAKEKDSTQVYRRRLIEMDPYVNFATRSVFLASQVPDAAVNIERFEWKPGAMVEMPASWEPIGFREQPLSSFEVTPSAETFPAPTGAGQPSASESAIPDWLRQAGWGEASGEFVERPLSEQEEPPLEKAELPEWLKAMAPPEVLAETPEASFTEAPRVEEVPDWLKSIEPSAVSQPETPAQPAEELPDWLKGMAEETPPVAQAEAPAQPAEELPDWLKGMAEETPPVAQAEAPAQPAEELPDWLKGMAEETPPVAQAEAPAQPAEELPDWLKGMAEETPPTVQPAVPAEASTAGWEALGSLGTSAKEQDEALAWLESLAARHGAKPEELVTPPEARQEKPPEWVEAARQRLEETPAVPTVPAEPAEELPDWLKSMAEETPSAAQAAAQPAEESPDWLKG
ncbi:MAG: tetratricopeptide repeat protein, partial [Anaerolineales bacterium]